MDWENLFVLIGVAVAVLVGIAGGIQLAGFFPVKERPPALAGPAGSLMIGGLVASLAVMLALSAWLAATHLPWPVAVIATGLAVLGGPLLFQAVPPGIRDSRAGTALTAVVNLGLILLLTNFAGS